MVETNQEQLTALGIYAEIFQEILNMPELKKSREFLEPSKSLPKIIKHALERQYLMGTMSEDFDIIKKDRDD